MSYHDERLIAESQITSISLAQLKTRRKPATPIYPSGNRSFIETAPVNLSPNAADGEDLFKPANPGVTDTRVVYHGGAIASGVPIILIYWGPSWSTAVNSQLMQRFDAAARSLVGGPFPSALEQYGVARPWVRQSIQVTNPGPPANFTSGNVDDLVFSLIDNGFYPEPDEDGGRNFYCVIMPPMTTHSPDGTTGGHRHPSGGSIIDKDTTWLAWIGNSDLDTMTRTFGHELVETCTDPEGDGWYVDSLGSKNGEIGDLCNSQQGFVNGVWAEYYWSNASQSCVLPTTMQTFAQRSKVAAITRNPNQMDIFAVESSGGVYSAWWHGDWHNWFLLNGAAFNQGASIAVISRNPNQMDLFVLGMDGKVRGTWWNGNWQGWFMLDGAAFNQGNSITALSRNPNQMDLFILGMDGRIRSTWWNGNWQGWFMLDGAAFNQGNSITVISRNPNQMDLFILGMDGKVRSTWWNGSWHNWFMLDGAAFSQGNSITAISRNPNQMDLFVLGMDGKVRGIWWNGTWHNWFMLDGAAFNQGNSITALSRNPNQMDLFVLGMDGKVRTNWWDGNWHDWLLLDGAIFSQGTPITAISRNPNQMDIFTVGLDGGIYSTWWDGEWHGWFRVL